MNFIQSEIKTTSLIDFLCEYRRGPDNNSPWYFRLGYFESIDTDFDITSIKGAKILSLEVNIKCCHFSLWVNLPQHLMRGWHKDSPVMIKALPVGAFSSGVYESNIFFGKSVGGKNLSGEIIKEVSREFMTRNRTRYTIRTESGKFFMLYISAEDGKCGYSNVRFLAAGEGMKNPADR